MTKEELEKEAEEYGKKATAWLEDREPLDQRDIENAYLAGAEPREKRIAELEKENTDLLKDRNRWMQVDKEDCENWSKDKNRLTKAKNALKKFVDFANGERTIPVKRIAEAEQFLNSEVEK